MSLGLRRSDVFVADFEKAYCWYLEEAGGVIARRFLESVWQTLELLTVQPGVGVPRHFCAAELEGLRSYRVKPPFQAHLIFYRYTETELLIDRLMHGRRDLPERLMER